MKKAFVFFSVVIGFMFVAAPTAVERQYHQVFLNGKPFAKAAIINGVPAVQLQEFAGKGGAHVSLEPFTLNGQTLGALVSGYSSAANQKANATDKWFKYDSKEQPAAKKAGDAQAKVVIKGEYRPMFKVNRAGTISTKVFDADGKKWVPLADIAAAFQGNLSPNAAAAGGAVLKQDQTFQINFASSPNAILIGL